MKANESHANTYNASDIVSFGCARSGLRYDSGSG